MTRIDTCPRCDGEGKTNRTLCRKCLGSGYLFAENGAHAYNPPEVELPIKWLARFEWNERIS